VFDTVGGDVAMRSFSVLKPGGRAAFIASGAQAPKPDRGDVTALRPAVPRTRAHLERIVELHRIGAVRVPPITEFSLAQAAEALRVSASRHLKGKLVLKLR
jgi:NADPH:quinone reductase-like Zn-dependent oxidoreductase